MVDDPAYEDSVVALRARFAGAEALAAMVAGVRLWPRSENRNQSADYTEVAIAAIEGQAIGSTARPQTIAAVEAAASMCESAFAAARAVPGLAALDARLLGIMGRAYVLRGEVVFVIGVDSDWPKR